MKAGRARGPGLAPAGPDGAGGAAGMMEPQPGSGAAPVPVPGCEEPPPSAQPGPGQRTPPGPVPGPAPPAKARQQRVLSPVWEEEPEPARGGRLALAELFPDLLQHVSRSPEPPLFRSFFAEECRAIVRQLRRVGLELSAIEAEPLPLDTTPVTPLSPARPGAGEGGPGPGAGSRLQALATHVLNLTVELPGSGPCSASFTLRTPEPAAARGLGSAVMLLERARLAGEPSFRDSGAEELERSSAAYRTHDVELVSSDSTVSLGSSSFATSTPLLGSAKCLFLTGSPLGDDLAQKGPSSSSHSVPRELPCPSQADSPSAAAEVNQSTASACGQPEEEACGKVPPKPPQRSAVFPVPSRSCVNSKDRASAIPTARRSLALPSSESWRAAKEILRVGLPPKGRGITVEGKARLSLSNSRRSLQKTAATEETRPGSSLETQPPSPVPANTPAKRSVTKLTCTEKGPLSLRPPSRFPALSSRPVLMGTRLSLGPGALGSSRGTVAPGTKLPTHSGTRLRLVKPGASSLQRSHGTPQPGLYLPAGNRGMEPSPQERGRESAAKPGCNKPPVRRAATTVMHTRLRPMGRTAASPRRLPSPKQARLDINSAAVPALETSGADRLSAGPAVVQDWQGAGEMAQPETCGDPPAPLSSSPLDSALESSMQLPGQLLSQELQRTKRELQRVKSQLAARDAQCEAHQRMISSQQRLISSLEAQLRAGSQSEGTGATQDCALEGE